MKHILTSVFLIVLLFPALALGEEVKYEDLVETDGLHYKKFTDVPFTGNVTGKHQGSFKDGKEGGHWVSYKKDGTVWEERTGTYRNGVKVK